ncbi:hypothetical protein DH2020_022500 [Rehmannia glutinosa]|uniref:uroporphyrinogen decarboxylase n=1 Tax=Rehmannia glutinosa TaxID=99300 RepID=A0ABR0WHR1_REHGL
MACIYSSSVSSISAKLNFTSISNHKPRFFCSLGGAVAEPKAVNATEPLLLNAARGKEVERPPVWLMRQAGRYMKAGKGPIIFDPIRTAADVEKVREFTPDESVPYVGEALTILRKEVNNEAALLGFVGAPFTLASYVVEGGSSKHFSNIKRLAFSEPKVLHALLQKFATSMAKYIQYQADKGAQAVQIFDSWATELSPVDFEEFSLPYLKQIVDTVKRTHPNLPLILYASGSGGLIERLPLTGVDVVSLDWTVDMAEGRKRLGPNVAVQGNVDPGVLFGSKEFITERIKDTVRKAGKGKHILNLGHGIVVGTPEENVAHFFEVAKGLRY